MSRLSSVLLSVLCLLVAGCSSTGSKTQFHHTQLGIVASDHPKLVSARDACGKTAYAQGIMINGKKVTDRNVALNAWAKYMVAQVMKPGTGATAGTQGALALTAGNPSPASQSSVSVDNIKKPPYAARMDVLEKQTWDCVTRKGFTKKT